MITTKLLNYKKSLLNRRPKKLAVKISFAYFVVILFTVGLSYFILNHISTNSAQKKINEASLQTITSIQNNVDLMIENINNYSKMIFSDHNLQHLLRQGDVYANLQTQSKVSSYLYNLMQAIPIIDSVNIFDNSGHRFTVGTQELPVFKEANIEDAPWYEQVVRNKGKHILRLNGGDFFMEGAVEENYVSLIRLIRDIDNTSPIGVLVINIKDAAFVQAYSNLLDQNISHIAILDENNEIIVASSTDHTHDAAFKDILTANREKLEQQFQKSSSGNLTIDSGLYKHTLTYLSGGRYDWKFVSITPYSTMDAWNKSLLLGALLLLIVNGIIFFSSSFIISRSIINPIHKLLRIMNKAPDGHLLKVNVNRTSYEFEELFNGYNQMIKQMDELLKRIVEEQKTLRKAELNTLQSQIKPHFLYNTLDSISSLALSGLNAEVCEMIEALGSYYRMSVSKGKDVISVGEEVEIVRNYLKIQKVRYQNAFEALFDIEEECCHYPIPKLVMQPLVENSLYHGIRPKGTPGTIRISVRNTESGVRICISDDGVGISEEVLAKILDTERRGQIQSIGLWGTMERLRIFYGEKDCISIVSSPGNGTTVTIVIPKGVEGIWKS